MKYFRSLSIALTIVFLTARATDVSEMHVLHGWNPDEPRAGDSDLLGEDIDTQWARMFTAKSQPPQLLVSFTYFPPTTSHK